MSVWQSLSALVRTLLMMSLAGSILAVLLYVLQPLWKYKIPKRVQYGLWCLVLVTFLVPVSAFVSLPVATPLSPVQDNGRTTGNTGAEAVRDGIQRTGAGGAGCYFL